MEMNYWMKDIYGILCTKNIVHLFNTKVMEQ